MVRAAYPPPTWPSSREYITFWARREKTTRAASTPARRAPTIVKIQEKTPSPGRSQKITPATAATTTKIEPRMRPILGSDCLVSL